MASATDVDVAILGGGPAGSTVAAFLRKYNPALRVLILEKERFPREHVGESQLPSMGLILHEMGVWDKVEAAGFPIKIGASYTWGRDNDRWDFDFYPIESWKDEPRPAKYRGQRTFTAFQVDRARYDEILLRHAESLGAMVREGALVREVAAEGDRVAGLELDGGERITARHYVDATGQSGLLRRAVGVGVDAPGELRNIAIWDYWDNALWAVEIGVGATRVQVRSLPYGWMWFIPLGPTRTSIGLICPAEHYKRLGVAPADLYRKAVAEQHEIAKLTRGATPSGEVRSCKDWSQLAARLVGDNWFLVGDAAGFADPILAAGLSLSHSSARDCAYTILELGRAEHPARWLKDRYDERHRANIGQHIRFAQYWYSANSCFSDLREHCQKIAREAGLNLAPQKAWQWLSQGGFTNEALGLPGLGSFDVASAKRLLGQFDQQGDKPDYLIAGHNVFRLNLVGAKKIKLGRLDGGRIERVDAYERGPKRLPLAGYYSLLVTILQKSTDIATIRERIAAAIAQSDPRAPHAEQHTRLALCFQALEVLVEEGWVARSKDPKKPFLQVSGAKSRNIRSAKEVQAALDGAADLPAIRFNA